MASALPTQAQVVIIGGGVGGCSIAYHLTRMGWKDVVILERGELTCGSTWHSAGLVGQLRSDFNLTRMMKYSTDLYRRLKEETGVDTGWREVGGLRLASSPERMVELKRQVGFARSFGMPLELISTEEAHKMWPLMNPKGVLGAVYTPTDGGIDPTGLTNALAAGAKKGGARLFTDTRVTAIHLNRGRVNEVVTDQGTIRTEVVVNAAGQWGNEIAGMVGVVLPIIPFAHLYLITKPIEGLDHEVPTMRDPDLLVYWREEVGGLVTGGYERNPKPFGLDGIPEDFKYKLLPPDWERFTPLMENSIKRVPAVEKAEIVQLLNGPEGFTPDGEFLLGPTDVKGFWVACAFCAHGLAGAGGIGKAMAEWIVEGTPEWNCWRLDLRRFGPHYIGQQFTLNRTVESNSRYYDIHLPGEERQTERNFRFSPAFSRESDLGASFGEKFGWERPNWYTPYEKRADHGYRPRGWAGVHWSPAVGYEHLQTRSAAGLFDETSFSKIEVRGPGAVKFLQTMCSNDIDKPVGSVVYTSMLNDRGGIECDFTVTRMAEDRFLIVTGTAFGVHDINWIRLHTPDDGSVAVDDVTSSYACLGLWGPKAREILKTVTRDDVSNAGFPYMSARRITVGNIPALAMRVTYVGEMGWEFYCGMEYGQKLWDTLWQAGQPFGLVAAGYKAIDTLRLEKGYRYWSADITPDYTPYETGMGMFVRLEKGDFRGKKALERQKKEGVRQKLCCMTLDDASAVALGNEPIFRDGQLVGWATSGGYGYSVKKSIAYGYLPLEIAKAGTRLEIELFGERIGLTVEKEPLFDPKGERIKA
jgi:4-methylaminobutanoate oxidase (formaldehyde-forming)